MAVEAVAKKDLETLAQENIFKPFGMTRTSYLWQPAFESDYALGHDMNGDTLRKNRRKSENAAGSMETTVGDYSRFVAAAMQGKRLSAKSYQEMFSPQIAIHSARQFPSLDTATTKDNQAINLSYGLGWGLFNSSCGKAFFKEGHDDGWNNYVIAFPDKKIALVILCNSSSGESIFKELVEKLTGVTIPWYWEGYTPYRANVKLPEDSLKQFAGVYEGKLKAIISIQNGQLKAESPTVNLPKTNLYASNGHHFFLKVMDTDIEFVKDPDGKVTKMVLDDEGEHYELTKTQ
jgi:CubicO group peptidase (beta-lactamase class C family)